MGQKDATVTRRLQETAAGFFLALAGAPHHLRETHKNQTCPNSNQEQKEKVILIMGAGRGQTAGPVARPCPWASNVPSLSLSFLSCKTGQCEV